MDQAVARQTGRVGIVGAYFKHLPPSTTSAWMWVCDAFIDYLDSFDRFGGQFPNVGEGSTQQTSLPTRQLHLPTLSTFIPRKSSPHSRSTTQPVVTRRCTYSHTYPKWQIFRPLLSLHTPQTLSHLKNRSIPLYPLLSYYHWLSCYCARLLSAVCWIIPTLPAVRLDFSLAPQPPRRKRLQVPCCANRNKLLRVMNLWRVSRVRLPQF